MAAEVEEVFRVKRSSSALSLGSAIAHKLYDECPVVLAAIGAAAVNQAVKAVIIAQGHVSEKGWVLSMRGGFADVEMPDRDVTAIRLKVMVEK